MIFYTLTGNKRYRTQTRWFRGPLLVLEVEVRARGVEHDEDCDAYNVDYTYWRDAKLEDLNIHPAALSLVKGSAK